MGGAPPTGPDVSISQGDLGGDSVQNTIPYNNMGLNNQFSGPVTLTMNANGGMEHKMSNVSIAINPKVGDQYSTVPKTAMAVPVRGDPVTE